MTTKKNTAPKNVVITELSQSVVNGETQIELTLNFTLVTGLTDLNVIMDSVLDEINDLRRLYPQTKCLMDQRGE